MSWPPNQYQQFQLSQNPVPSISVGSAPTQPGTAGFTNAMPTLPIPQPPSQPTSAPAGVDNTMQMLLARAMSIPLATVLFQSLMGNQQPPAQPAFPSPPVMQPTSQNIPPTPSQSPLLQMMQQAFQAGASSAVAAQPHVGVPPTAVPAAAVTPPMPQHLPSPSSASGSGASSAVHLPPMEPSIAKEMLVQLVQQLQQAGQLPHDDSIMRLLQPNASQNFQSLANVVVKKEEETGQQPGQICVVSKTESLDDRDKPRVYMDVAEEGSSKQDTDSDGDRSERGGRETSSHSLKASRSKTRSSCPPKNKAPSHGERSHTQTRQESSSRTTGISTTIRSDPKLQRKCIVKLHKVNSAEQKPLPAPSSQLSRVDRLKNMKKYISTDILHSHNTSQPGQSHSSGGSFRGLADIKPSLELKVPVSQQSEPSSARVGTRNLFSIFAPRIGRGAVQQQEEPPVEVKPSDPMPQTLGVLLQRSVNAAQNKSLSLRSMYLGFSSHNMEWLSLVSSMFAAGRKTFCQCSFCPKLGEFPRDMAMHIIREHEDLIFALNKLKPPGGPTAYIKCRHCNYVTVESTLAWIHFDIHHGISNILDCSEGTGKVDLSGPDMPAKFIDIDDVMGPTTSYVCFECSAVNADPDTRESSMLMARHVARQHAGSVYCNGNFVKLLMLTRAEGDPDSIKGSPTYRQAINADQHARGRREVYICMYCRYSAFSPYLALSHSIMSHQNKRMVYICGVTDCDYQCLAEVDIIHHMKTEHNGGITAPLVCSATLGERKSSSDGFVECPVLIKRTGVVEYVSARKQKPSSAAGRASRNRRNISVSSDDSDEDDDDDDGSEEEEEASTVPSTNKRNTRSAPQSKTKDGGGKAKSTTRAAKRIRIDSAESDSELQNTTVTSSNDDPSATATTVATTKMSNLEESNEDAGVQEEVTETETEDGADETEAEELVPAVAADCESRPDTEDKGDETEADESAPTVAAEDGECPSETAIDIATEDAADKTAAEQLPPEVADVGECISDTVTAAAEADSLCSSSVVQPVDAQ